MDNLVDSLAVLEAEIEATFDGKIRNKMRNLSKGDHTNRLNY